MVVGMYVMIMLSVLIGTIVGGVGGWFLGGWVFRKFIEPRMFKGRD
jgi:membrane protein YqaA with SNARE-associated domain